jgi:hypothetical protein
VGLEVAAALAAAVDLVAASAEAATLVAEVRAAVGNTDFTDTKRN